MTRALGFLLLLFAAPAWANENVPLFYTREVITIQRLARPMPWQDPATAPMAQAAPPLSFDVEVRDAQSYYNQKDWFNLSSQYENSGVLLVFAEPGQSPIIPSRQYAPLDILFIDAQGRISQVIPNILLASLNQRILPQNPVRAFLFFNGGTCQRLNINPGDMVEYHIFTRPPLVLGDPVTITDAPGRIDMPPAPERLPETQTPPQLKPQLPPLPPVPEPPRIKRGSLLPKGMELPPGE